MSREADGDASRLHVLEISPVLTPWLRAIRTASIIRSSGVIWASILAVRSVGSSGSAKPSDRMAASRRSNSSVASVPVSMDGMSSASGPAEAESEP